MNSPIDKYRPFPTIHLPDRQWPNRTLQKAPQWCSVDLRDGNQALAQPMNVSQKLEMFDALVRCGFKEIEVGFPAASNTEFEFVRRLIEDERIPDDVTMQVLVQAREDLIEPTMQALVGAKRVIIHLYNSTSPAQRRVVFGLEKDDIVKIATRGTQLIKEKSRHLAGTEVIFQYSPESFSATEVEFSLEICEAVMDVWGPTPESPIILNLPETVEVAMPNVYADQIEWFCRNLKRRDCAVISVHTHNDRGTGVAATELGLLAGAERVEGTLFGNGERTGNLDIITVALNLHMHGIDCGLDFADLSVVEEVYERCTGMSVDPRHPYAGELVFTAFSGSHQDAIKKALTEWKQREGKAHWDVPYLAIDPHDIGRTYSEVIRVNSQSGKGGVAYLLESKFGIDLPKEMQREFGPIANAAVDSLGREVSAEELKSLFRREYIQRQEPYALKHFHSGDTDGVAHCQAHITRNNQQLEVSGTGNGPIAAFVSALQNAGVQAFEICDYREQAMGRGAEASAIAYICIRTSDGKTRWGAGVDTSIELASIKAVLSALNRL
ncbi:MAG TPA: 2-isopropylmalate synthase [Pirellulales bacterium]|jgi:2-isopropylmalate synthase|nr:2-isopropylmalate synthase [Pirellulales bacterium]